MKDKKTDFRAKGYSLIGLKHSGAAVSSFGGEIASFPQLRRCFVRTSITHIDLFLHGLHTLQKWHSLTKPHWMIKWKQSQFCSLPTCEIALNALVLPNLSPSLERDSAECIAVFAAPSTPSLIFLPISVRLTSPSPYSQSSRTFTDTMNNLRTVCNWLQKARGIFFFTEGDKCWQQRDGGFNW